MQYLLQGSLTAKDRYQNELADILLQASSLVSKAKGCKLYVIGKNTENKNAVYVTEIWDSKEDHDNSLKIKGVRELISKAMPLLDGNPSKGLQLEVIGGHGC